MDTLREVLDPHFLLRNSVYASLLVGFACPLLGVYLILRRLIFMGVALAPLLLIVAIMLLELLVAFLQAYVFAILTCIYLNEALHLHDQH